MSKRHVPRSVVAVSGTYAATMPDGSRVNILRRRADSTCKELLLAQAGLVLISLRAVSGAPAAQPVAGARSGAGASDTAT